MKVDNFPVSTRCGDGHIGTNPEIHRETMPRDTMEGRYPASEIQVVVPFSGRTTAG